VTSNRLDAGLGGGIDGVLLQVLDVYSSVKQEASESLSAAGFVSSSSAKNSTSNPNVIRHEDLRRTRAHTPRWTQRRSVQSEYVATDGQSEHLEHQKYGSLVLHQRS